MILPMLRIITREFRVGCIIPALNFSELQVSAGILQVHLYDGDEGHLLCYSVFFFSELLTGKSRDVPSET